MPGPVIDLSNRADDFISPIRKAGIAAADECYGPEPDHELLSHLDS